MLDREVVKDFLIDEFEDLGGIPKNINLKRLAEDFSIYVENDYYQWLKDNFNSYFYSSDELDWDEIRERIKKKSKKK
ncbi:MAG: hypothetical protein KA792_08970 [Bacteroidales bacterium]|nr:hypothetical protein [Bacteroidales bacterium]